MVEFRHEPTNTLSDPGFRWWIERWVPPSESSFRVEGENFGMLRLTDGTLVVLRFPHTGETPDFRNEYVVVGRPETIEAGLLLMELLSAPTK